VKAVVNRRIFLGGAIAVAVVPTAIAAQTPFALHLTGTGADDIASVLYAQKAGLFGAAGLVVDYERANSGAAGVAAVVSGAKDVGKSSLGSLIAARVHNVDLKIVAGGALFRSTNLRAEVQLIVASDSPLRSGKDFNGKTISVPALGDQNVMAARAWVDQQGGDSRTLQFVEVPSAAAADAVAQGRVAAAVLVPPFAARAIADGKMRSVATPFTAIAPRFLETAWFTTAAYADAHRDQLGRFVNVIAAASGYVDNHNAELADTVAQFTGQTVQSITADGISFLATSAGPADVQPLIDAMAKYGLIDHRFDAADFFTK